MVYDVFDSMSHRTPEIDFAGFTALSEIAPDRVIKAGRSLLSVLPEDSPASRRAFIHYRIGQAHIIRGEFESAFRSLTEARQIHEETEDFEAVLKDQLALGVIYGLSEQHEAAFEAFIAIRDRAKDLSLPVIEGAADCNLGRICCDQKRFAEGRAFLNAALKKIDETGQVEHRASVLHELGRIELREGFLESAEALLKDAVSIMEALKGQFSYEVMISLGELYTRSSRYELAREFLDKALNISRENGIRHGETQALYFLGNLHDALRDNGRALECWKECYRLTDSRVLRHFRILSGERLVDLCRRKGEYSTALMYMEEIRKTENTIRTERLHHTISACDQSMRIDDLEQEMQAWRRRSAELERIRTEREESIRELETIKNIGEELTGSLDPDRIVRVLYDRLSQIVAVNGLVVGFLLHEENELDIRYVVENGGFLEPSRCSLDQDNSLSSWVIRNDRDLIVNTREEAGTYTRTIHHIRGSQTLNESFLFVRLKFEGRIIGILSVQASAANSYRERHLNVLKALAGFVAIALVNSNAHQSLVMANQRIAFMATHDPMTGLPNRMQIIGRLEQELNRCRRYQTSLAVLFVDLDGFKNINDTHGHGAGDAMLKEVATRLSTGVRATDAVGRLAGDEFLVILTDNCTVESGRNIAEQIRYDLEKVYRYMDKNLGVTGSIGLAFFPVDGENSETLINAADEAMYAAKAQGKNRTFVFNRKEA
jgi:diguanylate cyclase (GGDEF)-like protein